MESVLFQYWFAKRDEINRWIKDVANNYLPFIIVEKQLHSVDGGLDYLRRCFKNSQEDYTDLSETIETEII